MKFRLVSLVLIFTGLVLASCKANQATVETFDGELAYSLIETQITFGPRYPSSEGHSLVQQLIRADLENFGWSVENQEGEYQGNEFTNILGTREPKAGNYFVLIGTHYDTRMVADRSENVINQSLPVPGANDGASGVAVLLELARVLPKFENIDVQLIFFDAEDNGYLPGWDWIIGSTHFAKQLTRIPDAVIIVDMIGDSKQEIYIEKSSDRFISNEIWGIAKKKGISTFIPEEKYHMLDDHTPFLGRGIPSVLIIDFDYPFWHTTEDTLDKISADSLENVGLVLQEWLMWRDTQDN